ncbi:unnamed protein product [Meganyctiphanes norvegica]|uniref:Forkhead box protein N3 n=1 Tax=Meganyctiphanes norvegica TaxID=48144 RepID=A0AAV2RLP1_MEGNR
MMSEGGGGGGGGGEVVGGDGDGPVGVWGMEVAGGEEVVVMGGGGATTLYNREDGATVLELADGTTTVLPPGSGGGGGPCSQGTMGHLGTTSRLTVKVEGGAGPGGLQAGEALTAIVDGRTGTATLVEGAEVVRTLAVSYATPILHHVFLHPAPTVTTTAAQPITSVPFILHPARTTKDEIVVRSGIAATSVSPSAGGGMVSNAGGLAAGFPALSSTPSLAELKAYAPPTSSMATAISTSTMASSTSTPSPTASTYGRLSPQQLTLGNNQSSIQIKSEDEELTSLAWLHQSNLLRGTALSPVKNGVAVAEGQTTVRTTNGDVKAESPTSDYGEESSDALEPGELALSDQPFTKASRSQPIPYNPQVHVNAKPPYSFSCLIFMAIEDSLNKALPVKDIYAWILEHFPYFRQAPTGWKNSVRHNLSLNKCFRKVEKAPNLGKGSLWMVDSAYRPNLLQALSKTPFHPYSNLDRIYMVSTKATYNNRPVLYRQVGEGAQGNTSVNTFISPVSGLFRTEMSEPVPSSPSQSPSKVSGANVPNPDLFPYLARRLGSTAGSSLAASGVHSEDVDAAAAMLALKHGPRMLTPANDEYSKIRDGKDTSVLYEENRKRKRKRKHTEIGSSRMMVISSSPSQDHAYTPGAYTEDEGVPQNHLRQNTSPHSTLNHIHRGEETTRGRRQNGMAEIGPPPTKKAHHRSPTSSVDEAFSDDSYDSDANSVNGASDMQQLVEGADALLNLAAVATSLASQRGHFNNSTPPASPPSPQYLQYPRQRQFHTETTTTPSKHNRLNILKHSSHTKNSHINNNSIDSTHFHNNNTINKNNNKMLKVKRFGTVSEEESSHHKAPARRNLNMLKK